MSALGEVTATCCSASRPSAAVLSLLITAVGAVCNPRSNAASRARLVGRVALLQRLSGHRHRGWSLAPWCVPLRLDRSTKIDAIMEDDALEALKARVTGGDLDPGLLRQLADALDAQTTKEKRRRLLRTGGRVRAPRGVGREPAWSRTTMAAIQLMSSTTTAARAPSRRRRRPRC